MFVKNRHFRQISKFSSEIEMFVKFSIEHLFSIFKISISDHLQQQYNFLLVVPTSKVQIHRSPKSTKINSKLVQMVSTTKSLNSTSIQLIPLSTSDNRKRNQTSQITIEKPQGKSWPSYLLHLYLLFFFIKIFIKDQTRRASTGNIKSDDKRTVVLTLDKADSEGKDANNSKGGGARTHFLCIFYSSLDTKNNLKRVLK